MKHVFPIILLAALGAACNNNPKIGEENVVTADTVGLAAYKQAQQQAIIDSIAAVKADSIATAKSRVSKTKSNNSYSNESATTTSSYPASQQKKGWSKAAKGAVIGGATGAAAGAVIHKKNRVVGGAVGAAAGAGVGYGIGRKKDKKDGRVSDSSKRN